MVRPSCAKRYARGATLHTERRDPPGGSRSNQLSFQRLAARARAARVVLTRGKETMTDREAKTRAVKILAKSIYRDLEAQGFDEKQIVALATELISEVTNKISQHGEKSPSQQVA